MMFVAAGVLTVMLGVALLLVNRDGPSDAAVAQPVAEEDGVKVLVAKEDLAVDADANEAFRSGRIEVRTVAPDARAADAVTSAAELDGRTLTVLEMDGRRVARVRVSGASDTAGAGNAGELPVVQIDESSTT